MGSPSMKLPRPSKNLYRVILRFQEPSEPTRKKLTLSRLIGHRYEPWSNLTLCLNLGYFDMLLTEGGPPGSTTRCALASKQESAAASMARSMAPRTISSSKCLA